MKIFYYLIILFIIASCSSSKIVDSWKSSEYDSYHPKKVLIVGMTDNLTARKLFEEQLKTEFENKGIIAFGSYDVFTPTFNNIMQTEAEIEKELEKIHKEGFDSILISAVRGVDEKRTYSGDNYTVDYYWRRFGRYYYLNQDVYFSKGYYNNYKVYHVEASLFNLKENNNKSLVWVASYDITDPNTINNTVNDYVNAITKALINEGVLPQN